MKYFTKLAKVPWREALQMQRKVISKMPLEELMANHKYSSKLVASMVERSKKFGNGTTAKQLKTYAEHKALSHNILNEIKRRSKKIKA